MWIANSLPLAFAGGVLVVMGSEISAWVTFAGFCVLAVGGLMAQVGVIAWGVRLGILSSGKST
jgi:hypothetical protein